VGEHPPLDQIDAQLGLRTNRAILRGKLGGSGPAGRKVHVTRLEKWLLKRAVSPVAASLGYTW
jgi:hypothetical protein